MKTLNGLRNNENIPGWKKENISITIYKMFLRQFGIVVVVMSKNRAANLSSASSTNSKDIQMSNKEQGIGKL